MHHNTIICSCPKARHEHGTVAMYEAHRCSCDGCRRAKAEYTARARNFTPLVDAKPARSRLLELQKAGMTTLDVAKAAGLSPATLYALDSPNTAKRRKKIAAATAEAIMAVGYRQAIQVVKSDHSVVDAETSVNQIKVLHCLGWTNEDVEERCGIPVGTLYRLLRGYSTTVDMAGRIDKAYHGLKDDTPPQGTELERARRRRAQRKAEENNWDVFLAA